MPRKASLAKALRWGGAAAKAGAAWLGLGLILVDDNPVATLGLVAVLLALAGGWAGRATSRPVLPRAAFCFVVVALVRWAAGTLAAALAAGCLAAGWALQVRPRDAVLVLAFFGGGIAAVSSPSWRLVLVFITLGVLTVVARPALGIVRQGFRRLLPLKSGSDDSEPGGAGVGPGPATSATSSPMATGSNLSGHKALEVNR